MKRIHAAAIALGLMCIIVVGVIIVVQPAPMNFNDLSWGVGVGESFQYEIRAWGYSDFGSVSIGQVVPLNSTSITVTVTDLPTFDTVHSTDAFASEVIFKNKVNCSFINGTALSEWANITLSKMLSGSILPIGNWSVLEALFPDTTPDFTPNGESIVTIFYDTWFVIKYVWYGSFDDGGSWTGYVSQSTGVPANILWSYHHGVDTSLQIELTLV
jgi:hypothetical protein